jgi:hypothetical protein
MCPFSKGITIIEDNAVQCMWGAVIINREVERRAAINANYDHARNLRSGSRNGIKKIVSCMVKNVQMPKSNF